MQDLTKQLQCEKESVNEWQMRRDKRMLVLASMQTSTPQEKALFRQMKDIHSFITKSEKVLRELMVVQTSANVGENKCFSDTVKKTVMQQQRELLLELYKREAYLQMAKELGYEAAEDFMGSDANDTMLNDDEKKKFEEVKKKHEAKAEKSKESAKYKMKGNGWKYQGGYNGPKYTSHDYGMAKSFVSPYMQPFVPVGMQSAVGSQQVMGSPQMSLAGNATSAFRPWINYAPRYPTMSTQQRKANSKCKACDGVGHWQGDMECPIVMAAMGMGMLNGPDNVPPPPPGTG